MISTESKRLCWFIPDDHGGGVASVVLSCVRQARAAGHDAVLLLMRKPSGWMDGVSGVRVETLGLDGHLNETPRKLIRWLGEHPQDVFLQNGGEQADPVIPYLPAGTRCLYVVHDTARRFWETAVTCESSLDGIVAVSQTVADQFAAQLNDRTKLRVIHNGSLFPPPADLAAPRPDDLVFLGGDNPTKGAYDVLKLWPCLLNNDFKGRLHWFGALTPKFARHLQSLPCPERVLRHGRTHRDEIFAAASTSKVLLMLSRVEPFGMATIEAMGMGCLPVAWDIPTGTKEIVGREVGFFAPLGEQAALAAQVLRACAEHPRLAGAAAKSARQDFGEEAMWRRYADLLQEVTRRPAAHRPQSGQTPPDFVPPRRYFQLLPSPVRHLARVVVGRSARLGYLLRDFRGR